MTSDQKALVQTSWKLVSPISSTAADLFYGRLFELDPSLRKLFPDDIKEQKLKLMQTLAYCVHGLDHLDRIVSNVQALGIRHNDYHVKPVHYQTVGTALLWALEQGLGPAFTNETRQAWIEVYTILSGVMIEAAQQSPNAILE